MTRLVKDTGVVPALPSIALHRSADEFVETTLGALSTNDLFYIPDMGPGAIFMLPPQTQMDQALVLLCVSPHHDHGPCKAYVLPTTDPGTPVVRVGRADYVRWDQASDA